MRLDLMSWPEVEDYLSRSTTAIVPIGSTEQHGPNGLIGTDALTSEAIAQGVGNRTGTVVTPVISVGMAQHHMAFPGSITLRPSTLIAYVCDYVNSLSHHGFRRFYFINGHGGNIATLTAAFSELYAQKSLGANDPQLPSIRCALRNWWVGDEVQQLSKELFGASEGGHATPSEVSVTYYLFPKAQKTVTMSPDTAPRGAFYDAISFRSQFPDGRIGSNPGLARVEHGDRIFNAAVNDAVADFERFNS
jgi:creatinine amidohydrolase